MKTFIWQVHLLELNGIYQCAKNFQNIPNGLRAMVIFANWQTDRRTRKVTLGHSLKVNLSIGRIGTLFCGSCNLKRIIYRPEHHNQLFILNYRVNLILMATPKSALKDMLNLKHSVGKISRLQISNCSSYVSRK